MDLLDDSLESRLRLVIEVLGQSVDDLVAARDESPVTVTPVVENNEETRKLNAHVSRLHAALAEQTVIARREANAREKLESRNASMQVEMRDMRAAQKLDLAESRAEIGRMASCLEAAELALVFATVAPSGTKPASVDTAPKEKNKSKSKRGRAAAKGAKGTECAKGAKGEKAECAKVEKAEGNELRKVENFDARVYEASVRISAAIAELEPRALTDDDILVMRTASDVHCTTSVLDARGILVGLVHVMCPFAAMRAWVANAGDNEEYVSAVREIRADATSKEARGAFARAIVEIAQHDPLGKRILDRGPGLPGPVREITSAARRCKLNATPDEMLAWLVRSRARTLRCLDVAPVGPLGPLGPLAPKALAPTAPTAPKALATEVGEHA